MLACKGTVSSFQVNRRCDVVGEGDVKPTRIFFIVGFTSPSPSLDHGILKREINKTPTVILFHTHAGNFKLRVVS